MTQCGHTVLMQMVHNTIRIQVYMCNEATRPCTVTCCPVADERLYTILNWRRRSVEKFPHGGMRCSLQKVSDFAFQIVKKYNFIHPLLPEFYIVSLGDTDILPGLLSELNSDFHVLGHGEPNYLNHEYNLFTHTQHTQNLDFDHKQN